MIVTLLEKGLLAALNSWGCFSLLAEKLAHSEIRRGMLCVTSCLTLHSSPFARPRCSCVRLRGRLLISRQIVALFELPSSLRVCRTLTGTQECLGRALRRRTVVTKRVVSANNRSSQPQGIGFRVNPSCPKWFRGHTMLSSSFVGRGRIGIDRVT